MRVITQDQMTVIRGIRSSRNNKLTINEMSLILFQKEKEKLNDSEQWRLIETIAELRVNNLVDSGYVETAYSKKMIKWQYK